MKHYFFLLLSLILLSFGNTVAQTIGINTTTPHASSILDVKATGSAVGLLIPRLTSSNMNSINNPTRGMLIYNSTAHTLEVASSDNLWTDIIYGTTSLASNENSFQTGKIGIGTTTPNSNAVLDITSTSKGVVLPMATADPTGVEGMIYYNTSSNQVRVYDGTSWIVLIY
jgi:hypothetical protein